MKLNKAILSVAACGLLALTGQAATTNIIDWQFSVAGNPASPTAGTTVNPDGGNPLATFSGANNTYFFGSGPSGLYGSPTGLWDVEDGSLQLTLDLGGVGTAQYILEVFQFADSGRSFYPGTLTLSPEGAQFVSESVYVPQSGSMIGSWYEDTYSWSAVNLTSGITLNISGATPNTGILFDEVRLTVIGNLGPVPEPSSSLITAVGLLAFGFRSWLRRKG
jgi:hypothetical protein